jgi:two-component system, cell cycle response regulator
MSEDPSSGDTATKGARVLVVDDARLVRVVIAGILVRAGFDVDEAPNGAIALDMLGRQTYDVVISDLNMPEVDGFQLLAGAKRIAPHVEVIILTGTRAQDVDSAVRALRLGAHDYLSKPPSNSDEVVVTVERALEKKRLKDANQRLVRELESLSRNDALTNVLNRRSFDDGLAQEVARATRHGHPLGVVMLDIDHFKKINDTHGHPGGDEVLRFFAQTVKATLREGDALFRYGGEEFTALLPHADGAGAVAAARRIVSAVAAAPVTVGGKRVAITTSAGVACLGPSARTGEQLVGMADGALYAAKQSGRNRAVLHGPRLALVGGRGGA